MGLQQVQPNRNFINVILFVLIKAMTTSHVAAAAATVARHTEKQKHRQSNSNRDSVDSIGATTKGRRDEQNVDQLPAAFCEEKQKHKALQKERGRNSS